MASATKKDARDGASVLDTKAAVGGGVEDAYGEDRATEDQLVTPWTLSVARSAPPSTPMMMMTMTMMTMMMIFDLFGFCKLWL